METSTGQRKVAGLPTTSSAPPLGCGTVFKVTPGGELTTLYSFCSQQPYCADGDNPFAGLVEATDGSFYGTTSGFLAGGYGTVYKVTPSGTLTTLYSFTGLSDGGLPDAGLVQATNGYLYGTTEAGGVESKSCGGDFHQPPCGTIFRITPGGKLTTLHRFTGGSDGNAPEAGLVQATNGDFYGTTEDGGASNDGTVFKITPKGKLTTLYSFDGTDGSGPAGLIQAADGNLYGTTVYGAKGGGTVFRITLGGKLTTLYTFCSETNCTDGAGSAGALVQATDGNFYGTTVGGGVYDGGTIFQVTATGMLTTLYSFCSQSNCADGQFPNAALIQGTDGNLYGTTEYGGIQCNGGGLACGTVFSLSVGLGPFVETLPAAGKVGSEVGILGTNLTGAASVTFNGTPAQFTVRLPSLILTQVPSGATTGTVQVALPGGTLSSNVPFYVIP